MNCPQMLWVSGSQCHLNRLWENLLKCWGENWLWNYCCHLTSFKKKVLNILILDNNIVLFIINCGLHIMKLRTWDFTGHLVEYDKSKVWTFKLCENLKISFGGRIIIQVSLYRHWFFVFFFSQSNNPFFFVVRASWRNEWYWQAQPVLMLDWPQSYVLRNYSSSSYFFCFCLGEGRE